MLGNLSRFGAPHELSELKGNQGGFDCVHPAYKSTKFPREHD